MRRTLSVIACLACLACVCLAAAQTPAPDEARLLRFPAIHGDQIVFGYAGDLYTVPAAGGVARPLTSHAGYECFPRFSPDGKQIAFTGQYDGNTEVYVIPAAGGEPRRLTWTATLERDDVSDRMGPNNIVMGWTPDNGQVVFRSRMREFNDFKGQLYLAPLSGDLPEQLPLPRGGFCSYSPDGSRLAYNRIFREFRTWKRYRGGMADDVWIYDFKTRKTENITANPASDIIPMWSGNKVYFLSDRDPGTRMNLYVYDLGSKQTRQLTTFADFDVKFPSLGPGAIVFENGGYIYRFDLAAETLARVPIVIAYDVAQGRDAWRDVGAGGRDIDVSPDGKRVLFSCRGDIFTVPAKNGPTRRLTATPGVHERQVAWSPDGKWVVFISDASGEDELMLMPQDGSTAPEALTKGGGTYLFTVKWSPDSRKLLWSDMHLRLRYLELEGRKIHEVATGERQEFRDFTWSPDSQWIAYTKPEREFMPRVYLYSLEQNKSFPVTDAWYSADSPEFSRDGKYLFFASDRDFNPTYGQTEFNHVCLDMARVYLVPLAKETESPLKPESDEVDLKKFEPKKDEAQAAKETPADKASKDKPQEVKIKVDLDGITGRVVGLPVTPANYFGLTALKDQVYYLRAGRQDKGVTLLLYDFKERKEKELGSVRGYQITADGEKMLVIQDGGFAIVDRPRDRFEAKDRLDLSDLRLRLDRQAEWNQIFNECWRQMRDFFYLPNLHGVDWPAIRAKYQPLVKYVSHRADLTYLIGEMIGELNCGHSYVGGGDLPKVERVKQGLLGAELERDAASGYYRVKRVLQGENWNKSRRSPLTEVGVNVSAGDYILAVDGKSTKEMANIYESLVNTADKQVRLKVAAKPDPAAGREVTVVPVADELDLYYYNWVQGNIAKVDQASQGQLGYIHIPDMGPGGLSEFIKQYYPQLRKKALIVDVRGNGGGSVSPMIIERLKREMDMIEISRNTTPAPDPTAVHVGPKVALLDEFSASDGDIFPYRFRRNGMGELIGKRSWGGVVGIRGSLPLLDGGYLNRPEFASYDTTGKEWIIEGHGVDPDIVVDNDPAQEFAGVDEQLNKAIEVLLAKLKAQPNELPPPPPSPVK